MEKRLSLFLGRPILFNNAVSLFSPTIDTIEEIGELTYRQYVLFSIFNKEDILKKILLVNDQDYEEVANNDAFDVLTDIVFLRKALLAALSFFCQRDIYFNSDTRMFYFIQEESHHYFLGKNNYEEFVGLIYLINCLEKKKDISKIKFKNKKTERLYREREALQKKAAEKNAGDSLLIKDICSILCSYGDNGINIFNVHNLTLYQMYEHMERLSIHHNYSTLLPVWANGHLKENSKLPEIITKTSY